MSESSSILAADFGSVYTRVLFIDAVDGVYRLVARAVVRTTAGFPVGDITQGLRAAIEEIQNITGRTLLDEAGGVIFPEGLNRRGVDYFLATASGGRSLRAVLVGLMPGVSLESARHAVEGSYINVVDTLSLKDDRSDEAQLNAVLLADPDLIFVTGGTDGGAVDPLWEVLDVVKLAVASMPQGQRPSIIFAGNSRAALQISEAFEPLTRLFIADNVRPSLEEENLRSAQVRIGQAFDSYKEALGGGYDKVGAMSSIGLLPTAQSYRTVSRFLGKADDDVDNLIVVDVGSASSVLSTYEDRAPEESKSQIRTDIGLGTAAAALVESVPMERFRRWLPFSMAKADLLNYALNKGLRPGSVPQNRNELYIEHALLRVGIEEMLYDQRPAWRSDMPYIDRIIGVGSALAATGTPGLSAMLLMDALQPHGITELYTDDSGLIAAMGAISYVVPEAVVQLSDPDNLNYLGTVFSLEGNPRYGEKVGEYRIDYPGGDYGEGDITGGAIYLLDLPIGQEATVRVSGLRRGVRINGRGRVRLKVTGGSSGVIIDARGRPIPLEASLADRARYITAWYEFVSGVEHPTPGDDMLAPVEERTVPTDMFTPVDREAAASGRGRRRKVDDTVLDELLEGDEGDLDLSDLDEEKDIDLDDLRL